MTTIKLTCVKEEKRDYHISTSILFWGVHIWTKPTKSNQTKPNRWSGRIGSTGPFKKPTDLVRFTIWSFKKSLKSNQTEPS